jgi:signal transduction histidine kinase
MGLSAMTDVATDSQKTAARQTEAPTVYLQRIATIYSRLSPFFARLRRMPKFSGNTLLPSALSPIAPAMAYGHCGELNHGDALRSLEDYAEWRCGKEALTSAYHSYKETARNALLWAGWNYWDPTRAMGVDQRVIQVVLTGDLPASNAGLLSPGRTLLSHNGSPVLNVADFLQPPMPEFPKEVLLGNNRSNDADLLSDQIIPARLFLHNVWRQIFVESVRNFHEPGKATIVDHMLHEHESYEKSYESGGRVEPAQDFMALFESANRATGENRLPAGVRQFRCLPAWTDTLWTEVSRITQTLAAERPGSAPENSPTSDLLAAWRILANSDDRLRGELSAPLGELANALGPHVQAGRQAYVIFQHLALFDRFILSPNQYVFPVVFGRHVFVSFLAMKHPLGADEIEGWRQVVSALFGTLLVELLSQRHTAIQVKLEKQRIADEQRLMLSHSLPKSVFKPAEYFAVRLREQAFNLELKAQPDDSEGTLRRDALTHMAEAVLFLLQKGQAEIADYAQGQAWQQEEAAPIDLLHVCKAIETHCRVLKEFFIAGYLDRSVKANRNGKNFRAGALANTTIEAKSSGAHLGLPLVRLNRGLLLLHLWNVVDNAFRHADLASDGLILIFEVATEPERVCLVAKNTGERMPEEKVEVLNQVFSESPGSDKLDALRLTIQGWSTRGQGTPEFEGENRGMGLYLFNEYLASLWDKCGQPGAVRGKVEQAGNGTRFSFYFPREPE